MNAVEALGVLKFELRIRALEDLAATIMDQRDLLEAIVYGDDYDDYGTIEAESILDALKNLDNVDAMFLAEFDGENLEGYTSLNDLAQTADIKNSKIRKGITDSGE